MLLMAHLNWNRSGFTVVVQMAIQCDDMKKITIPTTISVVNGFACDLNKSNREALGFIVANISAFS